MRIALVHSFYTNVNPSGENIVVLEQAAALERAGHTVEVFGTWTDVEQNRALYRIRSSARVATGVGRNPASEIQLFDPEVVHVHNLFPNFGTRWLRIFKRRLILTLHNFRPLCTKATLFRDGSPCKDCFGTTRSLPALKHRCYRNSVVATLPLALANARPVQEQSAIRAARRAIVLTPRARDVYREAGLPPEKLVVLPNFSSKTEPEEVRRTKAPSGWLYAGRLTAEKGIIDLVKSWPAEEKLTVAGLGPVEAQAKSVAGAKIAFIGRLDHEQLLASISGYEGLIIPSRWYEGLPTIYLEALARGVPCVAFPGNSVADDVQESGVGVVSNADVDQLRDSLRSVRRAGVALRRAAYDHHRRSYTETQWLAGIERQYEWINSQPAFASELAEFSRSEDDEAD